MASEDVDGHSLSNYPDDDALLQEMGYKPSLDREFTSLSTISFSFSFLGLCSSVAVTFNTPLLSGGPASVTWCWFLGSCMCLALAASVAEIVSAFPTCGGIYTASANLCPPRLRPVVGWIIGWLSVLAQIVGLSSAEFGLTNMIWAAVVIAKDGNYDVTAGKVVALCTGLLIVHGSLNSLATRHLARLTSGFVFINLGATLIIVIVLLAMTPRHEMHSASSVFGSEGVVNNATGWNNGVAFLFGLLSVQWTMTGYDATAHVSEEVRRASYLAPFAIFIAVAGTGVIGWLLNIVLVLCSGPFENLPGPSDSAFLQILVLRIGKPGALFLWSLVCLTAFFVAQTGLQAGSRTIYAFSRDHGLPDGGFFGRVSTQTRTPLRAVWFTTFASVLPGLLDLASPIAANAIFAITAMAFDLSYIVPIFLRRVYSGHPDVRFRPGPFYMGDGWFGWFVNAAAVLWTLFVCVIFSIPNELPITGENMNYASPITGGVVLLSLVWYFLGGKRHYHGPAPTVDRQGDESRSLEDVKADDAHEKDDA
ncbi:uncharacterized protein PHACADRAFT_198715 [Phanerochaete carnosa HHB-10118-sp]|uniref:Amino acid permease/ SLC12A domain-containing protein n=1 Tax=Phanerochaete carnosa (strain HHB-10118-sp) TaxID=650164 RepID=K5VMH3_PHACS|nr:uncharacterized protein PHACADRAFT_198715 [Phanerochaete carnosa HHB-10118-sp]EKM52668.1 hypothetical protein PHACADRAFT_198715 [Phanerochaete carnosa HHB-10118-sp]